MPAEETAGRKPIRVNFGDGDLNADWIKYGENGNARRRDILAGRVALQGYYRSEGMDDKADALQAEIDQLRAEIEIAAREYAEQRKAKPVDEEDGPKGP